jgi:hypothetical protein
VTIPHNIVIFMGTRPEAVKLAPVVAVQVFDELRGYSAWSRRAGLSPEAPPLAPHRSATDHPC